MHYVTHYVMHYATRLAAVHHELVEHKVHVLRHKGEGDALGVRVHLVRGRARVGMGSGLEAGLGQGLGLW